MLLLISGALNSCDPLEINPHFISEHVYCNQTNHFVTIHCDSVHACNGIQLSCDWNIGPHCSIAINSDSIDSRHPLLYNYDSVMVKFDDEKYLMIGPDESIMRNDSTVRVSRFYGRSYHFITDELYDSAAWLIEALQDRERPVQDEVSCAPRWPVWVLA